VVFGLDLRRGSKSLAKSRFSKNSPAPRRFFADGSKSVPPVARPEPSHYHHSMTLRSQGLGCPRRLSRQWTSLRHGDLAAISLRSLATPLRRGDAAIAAEFHYSETAFVPPPQDPDNSARVRIFTPSNEIPFAGHPNVGTAFVLGRQRNLFGRPIGKSMCFEERAGLVSVELICRREAVVGGESQGAETPSGLAVFLRSPLRASAFLL
jgi:Phenazine biosynthesis-like protein